MSKTALIYSYSSPLGNATENASYTFQQHFQNTAIDTTLTVHDLVFFEDICTLLIYILNICRISRLKNTLLKQYLHQNNTDYITEITFCIALRMTVQCFAFRTYVYINNEMFKDVFSLNIPKYNNSNSAKLQTF